MARKKQEVWTRKCQDGRACGRMTKDGLWTSFVPDDQHVCDGCIETAFQGALETGGGGCCHHDDLTTLYTDSSVAAALRLALKGEGVARYFARTQEYFKKPDGTRVESWDIGTDRRLRSTYYWETLIFDSEERLEDGKLRQPIEVHDGMAHNGEGERRLKELNS